MFDSPRLLECLIIWNGGSILLRMKHGQALSSNILPHYYPDLIVCVCHTHTQPVVAIHGLSDTISTTYTEGIILVGRA